MIDDDSRKKIPCDSVKGLGPFANIIQTYLVNLLLDSNTPAQWIGCAMSTMDSTAFPQIGSWIVGADTPQVYYAAPLLPERLSFLRPLWQVRSCEPVRLQREEAAKQLGYPS